MADITIDDIRRYVEENGPKRLELSRLGYVLTRIPEILTGRPKEKRYPRHKDSISARIEEFLPDEGQISLSGVNTKVIMYDDSTLSYKEAALDISSGQPVPLERGFNLNGYRPMSPLEASTPLEIVSLDQFPIATEAVDFLQRVLNFNAPVIEIGKLEGLGYFPMKTYSKDFFHL